MNTTKKQQNKNTFTTIHSIVFACLFSVFFFFSSQLSAEAAFSLSGTVYRDSGVTAIGSGAEVVIKIGNTATTSTTTRSGGAFTIPTLTATGTTPITLFINASSSYKATTFVMGVDGTTNVTGIPLYKDTFITMSTTTTGVVDMSKLTFYDFEDDTDVLYHAPLNSTTTINADFLIATGTTQAPNAIVLKGSYQNNGTFTHNSGVFDVEGEEVSLGGFDLNTTAFDSLFSVSAEELTSSGVAFNRDGTKMFVIGTTGDDVNAYTLTTGFDVSTASVYGSPFSVAADEINPQALAFNPDGTKMFVLGSTGDDVTVYSLTIGFDVSTAASTTVFSVASQETEPRGLAFNKDGTRMFVIGQTGDDVNTYTLTTGFDVSTASFTRTFLTSGQELTAEDIAFNDDGTTMFILGSTGDDVNQYSLSTPYLVSTSSVTFLGSFSVSGEELTSVGLAFNQDGTKMFVAGSTGDDVNEYHLEAPFDLVTVFDSLFSVASQDANPQDMAFSSDGTKMYMIGSTGDSVYQYGLTTAFDVSTASYSSASVSVAAVESIPTGVTFSATGSRMYIVGQNTDDVEQYNLSTPWSVSSATHNATFAIDAQETFPESIRFNTDGTKMFVLGSTGDDVTEYALSTAWNISTAGLTDTFSVASQDASPAGIAFNTSGTKMFVTGTGGNDVNEYTLSVAFDVSTATFVDNFSVVTEETTPAGVAFNTDGSRMFILGSTGDDVNEYHLPALVEVGEATLSGSMTSDSAFGALTFSEESIKTFTENASSSHFSIGTTSTVVAPSKLTIAGDFTNTGGVFSHNSGTTTFTASEDVTASGTLVGDSSFGNTKIALSDHFENDGITWNSQSASEANSWISVVYGNGLFVAVAEDGTNRVMTSENGTTWTARSAVGNNDVWNSVTYGEGLFVAVGTSSTDRVMTSPDGITWTARSAAQANNWQSVTYGNGAFVAVAYDGTNRVMTSPDGITWTVRSAAEANGWRFVTYGNGLFVAVSDFGTNRVMTSPNGVTWTARSAAEANGWQSVIYGNGVFVAVSDTGTNRVMTSPDGITWTARSAAQANSWYYITYGTGTFVAVSYNGTNRVMTSPDGITWTARSAAEANSWFSVGYGNNLFVALSTGGTNRVMTSASGTYEDSALTFSNNASTSDLSIGSDSIVVAPPTLTIAGNYANSGIFTHSTGTVTFSTTTAQSISGTLTGSSAFYDVILAGSGTKTFGNNASTTDLTIDTGATLVAPSKLSVAGDYENSGTFTAGSGTVYTKGAGEGFDISTATFVASSSVNANDTVPESVFFKPDGLKMYVIGNTNDRVYEYSLTTAWDVTTKSFVNSFSVTTQDTDPDGLFFRNDGLKMYLTGNTNDRVYEYSLTTAWDISSASFLQFFSVASQNTGPSVVFFNPEGTKMYVGGTVAVEVNEYNLSTPWNISTAAFMQVFAFSSGLTASVEGTFFDESGTKMLVLDDSADEIDSYLLDAPWDVSSALYVESLAITAQDSSPSTLMLDPTGTRLFTVGKTKVAINRYSLPQTHNSTLTFSGTMTASSSFNHFTVSGLSSLVFADNASTSNFTINNASSSVEVPEHFSIAGNYSNSGAFAAGLGTTTFSGASAQTATGTMTGESAFHHLGFSGAGSKTFNANASSSNLRIESGATFVAPPKLSVAQNFTNNGTFTKGSGTVYVSSEEVSLGGYDLSTTAYNDTTTLHAGMTYVYGIAFNNDGTKMYAAGYGSGVYEYDLATPYDTSTAVYNSNFALGFSFPGDIEFNQDGTKMFLAAYDTSAIREYNLSTAYRVSTAVFDSSLSVAAQEGSVYGLTFSNDGTKMFMTGYSNNRVNEYNLGTAYDVSTAVFDTYLSVSSQTTGASSVKFNDDGTKMFVVGWNGGAVFIYHLSTAYEVVTAVYKGSLAYGTWNSQAYNFTIHPDGTKLYLADTQSRAVDEFSLETPFDLVTLYDSLFSVASQELTAEAISFNTDGTKMFVLGSTGDDVNAYTLTTGFDVSTATFVDAVSISGQELTSTGLAFSATGTKMYVLGTTNDTVYQYALTTPWDLSTALYASISKSVAAEEATPRGLAFSADGTKMYVIGDTGDDVNEYTLSTAWNVSTASYSTLFSIAAQELTPQSLAFNTDGTKMFVMGDTGDDINEYHLGTPWSVASAVYNTLFSIATEETTPTGLAFNSDGTKLFVAGTTGDDVNEYHLPEKFAFSSSTLSGNLTGTSAFNDITFAGVGRKTFGSNASTTDFSIATTSPVYAPSHLSIAGDYTNSGGRFEAGTGTTTFSGTSAQTATGTMTGTSAFYNLNVANTAATTTFGNDVTADNNLVAVANATIAFPSSATTTAAYITLDGTAGSEIVLRSTNNGTQWKFDVDTQRSVTYVDVKDSNACPGIDISATSSIDSGNNDCWNIVTVGQLIPGFSSAANQVFALGQATTSISAVTITDSFYPNITAANDIRIAIATSSVNMKFDTTDTTATLSGTASGKVSGTVSYEGNGSVLVLNVTSSFSSLDTLTVSDLSFAQFGALRTATSVLSARTDGASDVSANATDDKTITITGTFTVANHDLGQVVNAFSYQNQTAVPLYALKITPANESFTVSTFVLNLTGVRRIDSTKVTNLALYRDKDSSGTYSVGDVAVGGTGVLAVDEQTGTITFSTPFLATTSQNYLVVGDTVTIKPNEYMTLSLNVSGGVTGVTSLAVVVPSGSVSSIQHARGGGLPGGGSIGGDAPAGAGIVGGGGGDGGDDIDEGADTGEELGSEPGFQIPSSTGTNFGEWTGGANVYVSDASYATAASANLRQSYSVFGFNVPGGNTVQGIEVKLEASGSTGAGTIEVALSWDSDSSVTATKQTSVLTSSDAVYTLGGPSDTWGRAWTPTELSNANFFVRLIGQPDGNTVRVDAFQVRPYHQAGGGGGGGGGEI